MLPSQRPRLLTSLAALVTCAVASSAPLAAAPAQESGPKGSRPNILFIFSDDHATDAIGAYGGRLAEVDPTASVICIHKYDGLLQVNVGLLALLLPLFLIILLLLQEFLVLLILLFLLLCILLSYAISYPILS